MLTGVEEAGIKDILKLMRQKDVVSLATTITNHLIKLETLEEAVNSICLYATSAADVLSRRKVKKETLFQYLYQKKVATDPNGEKIEVVNAILELWQIPPCQSRSEVATTSTPLVNHLPAMESPKCPVALNNPMQQLGETFTAWFFRLLNSVHPRFSNPIVGDAFGAHHFWSDCRLRLDLQNSQQQMQHSCDSAEEVAATLRDVVLQVGLFFNPNVTKEGVQTECDVHGLVRVRANGVVHTVDTCVGVFKQGFGLVQDVTKADNWKIKFTELRAVCNSENRHTLPILQSAAPCQSMQLSS